MIRVLIVDDSPTLRELIRNIIDSDPELKVVGEARDGEEAIALCARLNPDIITMDIQMPRMDGYQAIRHIMAEYPRPILVLTGTESDIRHGTTFKGIEAGAMMVLKKPRGVPKEDLGADQLIDQVKAMAGVKVVRRSWGHMANRSEKTGLPGVVRANRGPFSVIAIGASTGGPPAIRAILDYLPPHLPMPVMIVQHISPGFAKGFARWLNDTTPLLVKMAENGEAMNPGVAYLAADNRHLMAGSAGRLWLMDSAPVDGHRPSVTALFHSIARSYGAAAMGILLTGMGRDGADGLKRLQEAGAHTIAQDEQSSIVFGMPKEAIAMGAANEVLPLEDIGKRLKAMVNEE